MTQFSTASADIQIYMDGGAIDADFFDAIARDQSGSWDAFAERVSIRVNRYFLRNYGDEKARAFDTFEDFRKALHAEKVGVCYVYDGELFFNYLEWELKRDNLRKWERTSKDEQRDENGAYRKVTGFKYAELSGETGQRYSFSIWSKGKNKSRHEVTRGTHFYAFKNVFNQGLNTTAAAFDIETQGKNEADVLYNILEKFNMLCKEYIGEVYTVGKKPLALTAGSLARIDLFSCLYGKKTQAENEKAFKQKHNITKWQGVFFKKTKLMRGGIVCANNDIWGRVLVPNENGEKLKKYDVRSEYSSVARVMPDLVEVFEVPFSEIKNKKKDHVYIYVFSLFQARKRPDMPAVLQNPFNLGQTTNIYIATEFSIFADELEELQKFYYLGECVISRVLAVKTRENDGFSRFVDKWYNLKEEARKSGKKGLAEFAKLMNNGAWGQLGKRSFFPVITHEYDENLKLFVVKKRYKEEETEESDGGKYSVLQNAYICAYGRIKIMQYIRRICGEKKALDKFVYTDTDSIITYAEAPAELLGEECGKLKLECVAVESKYLAKKVYYNISSVSPLKIEIHARGINADAIYETLLNAYGETEIKDLPPRAFSDAFTVGQVYAIPALIQVNGGRVKMYVNKSISKTGNKVFKSKNNSRGLAFAFDETGQLVEL